ncbi:heme-degrading monooxygenase HmoA [Nonomuraea fuscirosea]|uniref:Heme-degrading monooxygenase HmoA n=1 Tax=Nonomuraea fuscirosea TaxID=1291556 RepID=A0A2T0MXF0_9ACTN|nr:antibiotic biosynthesis monooxygenase family protein [Nonomuraea fuscirosea]PRX63754.1 heme-degrading monooxygenase HmoA [Nonomuraea fuscirosea]
MFRVILRFAVKEGTEAGFERTWEDIAERVSARSTNLDQWLLRGDETEPVYYVVTDWRDEAAFRQFEHSAEHVDNRRALDRFRAGSTMTTMRLVTHLRGKGAAE